MASTRNKNTPGNYAAEKNIEPEKLDLLGFMSFLSDTILNNLQNTTNNDNIKIPYEVKFTISEFLNISQWYDVFTIRENREGFIKKGEDFGRLFYEYIQSKEDDITSDSINNES